ncbi:Sterol regulatory element-binding protein [Paramyrothecium foliicola]|nr:Sterol regulatory element-binding protein [Paramyrothecium foliicola]
MPRPALPPTPGSSSDIKGQDGSQLLSSLQLAFELPPPAIHDPNRRSPADSKASPTASTTHSTPLATPSLPNYPMQAAETVKARRRSSAAKETKENTFALPPPPTRSRKIIQMKPRPQDETIESSTSKETGKSASKSASNASKTAGTSSSAAQGKKKQPSASSAAGRKIARKTAHSLIERRRRSKMNEEFAVLKGMIPACTGEMHKLAILQASIEYVRYLEDCVTKLKAQHNDGQGRAESTHNALPSIREFHPTLHGEPNADVEMTDSEAPSPTFTVQHDASRHPSISPALYAQDSRQRQHSYSSVSTDHRHYSYSASAGTSPAFGPQAHAPYAPSNASIAGSTLTSPALNPQSDLDQEATAALLMLNNDRRGTINSNANGRGLSVRDLLSF